MSPISSRGCEEGHSWANADTDAERNRFWGKFFSSASVPHARMPFGPAETKP
jgi:hypothetical protein